MFAAGVARLANTLCIAMPGVPAATQVMALDLAGVMVSAGAACSSGKLAAQPVLTAMGVPRRRRRLRHPHQPWLEHRCRRYRPSRRGVGRALRAGPGPGA